MGSPLLLGWSGRVSGPHLSGPHGPQLSFLRVFSGQSPSHPIPLVASPCCALRAGGTGLGREPGGSSGYSHPMR